jgi:multiple antibiotic resistance protein
LPKDDRRRIFNTASVVAFVIAIVIVLGGQQILKLFGIDIYSFMIAGGFLLGFLAIKILVYGEWLEVSESKEEIGAVPIAFPLLVGPGTITTLLVFHETSGVAIAAFSVLIVIIITRLVMHFVDAINRILGKIGSIVVARLMAVFIAAIAVEFIITGVKHSFP